MTFTWLVLKKGSVSQRTATVTLKDGNKASLWLPGALVHSDSVVICPDYLSISFSAVLVLQQNIADFSSKTDQATIRPCLFHRGKVGQGVSRELRFVCPYMEAESIIQGLRPCRHCGNQAVQRLAPIFKCVQINPTSMPLSSHRKWSSRSFDPGEFHCWSGN